MLRIAFDGKEVSVAASPGQEFKNQQLKTPKREGSAKTICQALDVVPTAIDSLVNRTGLAVSEVAQQLILLELKGQVAQVPGGYVRL